MVIHLDKCGTVKPNWEKLKQEGKEKKKKKRERRHKYVQL